VQAIYALRYPIGDYLHTVASDSFCTASVKTWYDGVFFTWIESKLDEIFNNRQKHQNSSNTGEDGNEYLFRVLCLGDELGLSGALWSAYWGYPPSFLAAYTAPFVGHPQRW
jgi:hypothetical protein